MSFSSDFKTTFSEFLDSDVDSNITILENLANCVVGYEYDNTIDCAKQSYLYCAAHLLTKILEIKKDSNASADQILSSMSVSGVSESYTPITGQVSPELTTFTTTKYGQIYLLLRKNQGNFVLGI